VLNLLLFGSAMTTIDMSAARKKRPFKRSLSVPTTPSDTKQTKSTVAPEIGSYYLTQTGSVIIVHGLIPQFNLYVYKYKGLETCTYRASSIEDFDRYHKLPALNSKTYELPIQSRRQ
jgi:hypothetical protein